MPKPWFRRTPGGSRDLQPRWPDRLVTALRSRRRGGRRIRTVRRAAALLLFALAGVLAVAPTSGDTAGQRVLVATRDLPAGATFGEGDLHRERRHRPPDGALTDPTAAADRTLVAPMRRGEIVTDVRLVPLVGPDAGPGRAAVPIHLADARAGRLLAPGRHVTVLAVGEDGQPRRITDDAVVLVGPDDGAGDGSRGIDPAGNDGDTVVVAVPVADADRLAAADLSGTLAFRFG